MTRTLSFLSGEAVRTAVSSWSAPAVPDVARLIEYGRVVAAATFDGGVVVVGPDGRVLLVAGEALALPPPRWRAALAGAPQQFEQRASGGQGHFRVQITPVWVEDRRGHAGIGVIRDLTDYDRLQDELSSERARIGAAEREVGFGQWEIDLGTGRLVLSEGARRLVGSAGGEEVLLAALLGRVDNATRDHVSQILATKQGATPGPYECSIEGEDGTRRRVLNVVARRRGPDARAVMSGTSIDVTRLRAAERARRNTENLLRQAFDGAPIGMASMHPTTGRYLLVNDALCTFLGRAREDLLALTVQDVTHPADLAADEAARQTIRDGRRPNFVLEKRYIRGDGVVVWGGVHVVPAYGDDGEITTFLCQIMDLTAHKQREQELIQEVSQLERLALVQAAIAAGRLVLHAQPIIELDSGRVVQQELLVRLEQEDGTLLPPAEFLPVAEAHGCIRDLDIWVTERAIEIAATGRPVQINLSAASVGEPLLLETIRRSLAQTGADPARIVFEVTETAVIADLARGRDFAHALRDMGCHFALDDFGTGYGTFTYLRHFPIDYVKIDAEFVRDLSHSDSDFKIVKAIVTMAKGLGKRTVAEGVEDAGTLERLRALGVDQAQGYYIGRPAPIALARSRVALPSRR